MIDVKDLRYGNIVTLNNPKHWAELKGVPLKVVGVAERVDSKGNDTFTVSLEIIDSFKEKYGRYAEYSINQFMKYVEPIAITEDLLPKIGFELDWKSKYTIKYSHKEFAKFGYDWGVDDGWKFRYYGHYFKCDFFHQIQNKYYELSEPQQELKIEL